MEATGPTCHFMGEIGAPHVGGRSKSSICPPSWLTLSLIQKHVGNSWAINESDNPLVFIFALNKSPMVDRTRDQLERYDEKQPHLAHESF